MISALWFIRRPWTLSWRTSDLKRWKLTFSLICSLRWEQVSISKSLLTFNWVWLISKWRFILKPVRQMNCLQLEILDSAANSESSTISKTLKTPAVDFLQPRTCLKVKFKNTRILIRYASKPTTLGQLSLTIPKFVRFTTQKLREFLLQRSFQDCSLTTLSSSFRQLRDRSASVLSTSTSLIPLVIRNQAW